MAQSFKVSPFTSLGSSNGVIADDYCHGTFETYKLKGASTNGSKFDYKVKINTTKKEGKVSANVADEGKIQFPVFERYTVQLGQRRKGDLRAHVDFGNFTFHGKEWNLFTNLKTDVALSKFLYRFGANYFGKVCESNTRLELAPGAAPVLTHRNYVKKGSHYYGAVFSLNLSTLNLNRYDALVGFSNDKYEANLKHESTNSSAIALGTLTANLSYTHDANTKVGAEVQNKGVTVDPSVTIGVQRKVNSDLTLKAKVDSKLNLSLASKYALNKQLTLTTALQLAFQNGKCCDLNRFPPLPLGLQLDINV